MPTWTIEEWPIREQPDDLLAELHHAGAAFHAEATPDDPRLPLADEIAMIRNLPDPEDGVVFVARDPAGAFAGTCWCIVEELSGWDHVLQTEISVLPDRRRQGLGRLLLDRATGIAEDRGLRLIMGRSRENVPSGGAFCRYFGAEEAMVGRENRLDLRSVDRELVDQWIAAGPASAPGYRLSFVAGRTPPDLVARVAEVLNVMNTAPRENMDVSDTPVTAELVAEYENSTIASGQQLWAYYAVDASSDRFVGLTTISLQPSAPDRVRVGNTAVDPAHRGLGLGKWLKATMTRRILDELPDVRWVITWNAGSNDAMLGINDKLGFRTAAVSTTWQITTSQLRNRLAAARGAAVSS